MTEEEQVPPEGAVEGEGDDAHPWRNKVAVEHRKPFDVMFSAGKPSRLPKEKLMTTEGIIPLQAGSNKHDSQKGMTGFGQPRDVVDKIKCNNLTEITDEGKISACKLVLPLQHGTNKYASQKGMTGFGVPRDVLYKPKCSNLEEVPEEKAKATDGIIPLQSGTNKLASQRGMTGFGMPRSVLGRYNPDQDRESQGFIHLQMGTNRFASQAGQTGFGMPRLNVGKYKDEARGELPFDEGVISRQTSGYKEGCNQQGMTGFGMPRNTTQQTLRAQDRKSQGMIPYQMGINWADSQAGKTGFGQPRQVITAFVDDTRGDLPDELARAPEVPFWSGMEKFASQAGMTGMGMPRDVKGAYVRRLW